MLLEAMRVSVDVSQGRCLLFFFSVYGSRSSGVMFCPKRWRRLRCCWSMMLTPKGCVASVGEQVNPEFAAQHQMVVIDCLEDPDETLKWKTLVPPSQLSASPSSPPPSLCSSASSPSLSIIYHRKADDVNTREHFCWILCTSPGMPHTSYPMCDTVRGVFCAPSSVLWILTRYRY
eukprot:506154-Rhodomonas_salina.4